MDAASGTDVLEAAVLAGFVCSFDLRPVIVRLVQHRLLEVDVVSVLIKAAFDPVLDVQRIVRIAWIAR